MSPASSVVAGGMGVANHTSTLSSSSTSSEPMQKDGEDVEEVEWEQVGPKNKSTITRQVDLCEMVAPLPVSPCVSPPSVLSSPCFSCLFLSIVRTS